MDKTLRKKLTEKYHTEYTPTLLRTGDGDLQTAPLTWPVVGLTHEMNLLKESAKDLLQPRPEAIARLLELAKEMRS